MKKKLQAAGLIFTMLLLAKVGMAQTYTFSPANDATGVSTSPTLTITFEEEDVLSFGVEKKIFLYKLENGHYVNVGVYNTGNTSYPPPTPRSDLLSVDNNVFMLDLTEQGLDAETTYYIYAEEGFILNKGNPFTDLAVWPPIWSFTTGAAPVPPSIVNYTPEPGSTGVSVNPTFIVEFDGDIDSISKGSSGYFKIMLGSTEEHSISSNSSKVSVSGKTLTVDATDLTLAYNSEYHIEIDQDFIQNFAGILDVNEWEFTTEIDGPKWAEGFPNITQSLTDFTFTGKTDLGGTYYFVVTDNFKPPTIAQIKAGQGRLGGKVYESSSETMIGNDEFIKSKGFSEMTSRIPYYLHAVVTSDDEKNSEIETLFIDRIRPIIEDESSNPINGYHLFNVHDSIKIVFSKKVFNYNGEITELTSASFNLKNGEEIVPFDFSVSSDGTEVTLTPTPPLSGNTEYTLVISPLSDEFFNVMSGSVTRTFSTDQLNVWTGNSSSNWSDAGNWDEDYVSGKSVLILSSAPNSPIIKSDITVNNFTIEAGAVVAQNRNIISVLGDFDLLSSVEKNATYIPNGGDLTVAGETRVHQHIVPEHGTSVVYIMGPPTLGATNINVGTEYKIKSYDNGTDSWSSINENTMQPGIGYSVYAENNLVFRGDINRDAISHTLVRTDGKGYGWNVMGNPFTAGMQWGKLGIDTATVENSFWIWDPQNKVYNTYNQEVGIGLDVDGTIPSNHGFLVKLKIGEETGSITFKPAAMVANNTNYLKSASTSQFPHMKISAGNAEFTDLLAVAFVTDASAGVDKYDTEKFFGSGNPFQIFTVEGATKLSINSLPDVGEDTTINLGYQSSKAGFYTIRLKEDNLEHSEIVLTDTQTRTSVDLLQGGEYAFKVDKKETNNSRFTLTFPKKITTSVDKNGPTDNTNIYIKDGYVIVDVRGETESLTYEMVGVNGNVVGRGSLHSGINNLGKFPSGLFIINIRNGVETFVSKKLLVTH